MNSNVPANSGCILKKSSPLTSVLWLVAERIVSLVLSLVVTLAVARHLMPDAFGQLSYLLALASLAAPFMALGLNSLVSREVLARSNDQQLILGTSIAMRGISGAVIALPATLLGFLYLSVDERHLFAFLILCSMFNAALVVEYWLQAYVANRYVSQVRLLTLFVFSAARIFAIYEDASLSVFVYLAGLEVICAGLLYMWVYNQLGGGITNLHYSWVEAKRLLKDSRWLILSGIAAIIYLKVDQVMLGLMVGDRDVGIYAAAARISEVWYFVPAAIVASFFPRLIDLRSVDLQTYSIDLQKLNDFLLYSALVVVAIVSYCATWLLPLLFGAAYEGAVPVLVVHIWAGLFVFMRTLLSKWFIAENLLKLSMASQVLGALVNILLNLKLIPLYGAVGAAYATVISLAVAGYVVLFLHPKLWPMALVVTRSFLLPLRLLRKGRGLYKV